MLKSDLVQTDMHSIKILLRWKIIQSLVAQIFKNSLE